MSPALTLLIAALIQVESSGNNVAVGDRGECGCLQIRPIVIDDVNRITATRPPFTLADRFSRDRSITIFRAYVEHYASPERLGREPTLEDMARIWNAGPDGFKRRSSLPYWRKVRAALSKL